MTAATVSLPVDVHGYGALGSRPAAGMAGREYVDSSTMSVYRDNGTSWDNITPPTGLTNPMTTKGDIIVGDTGGSPIRKAVGTDGWVLTADAASTGGIKWAAAAGGGGTIVYPSLKPSTPTDDFTTFSGWSAHSNGGSFSTAHCIGGGVDWGGSSLELQFSAQCGTIYKTQANTDFDFTFGGVRKYGMGDTNMMMGIAALNSSGAGVGVISYNDANCYFASFSGYSYTGNSDNWGNHGHNIEGEMTWFRLKRISGTWTGYVSQSGRAWDKVFATRADSITVAEIHFGVLYNSGSTYTGRIIADYYQKDA